MLIPGMWAVTVLLHSPDIVQREVNSTVGPEHSGMYLSLK